MTLTDLPDAHPALPWGPLRAPADREAVRVGERALSHGQLGAEAGALAARLRTGDGPVAVWATSELETIVGVCAGLRSGAPVVPINPKSGERELEHVVRDSAPRWILTAPGVALPPQLAGVQRLAVTVGAGGHPDGAPAVPEPEDPAFIVYTSGTTGPPKGAVLPHRAVVANLEGIAEAWAMTDDDVVVHALPLFHIHGLMIATLGPLRLGGGVRHLGRFSSEGVAAAFGAGATMMMGVPTMYHRLAADAERDPSIAAALQGARLLVSGSAALSSADYERLHRLAGQRVVGSPGTELEFAL